MNYVKTVLKAIRQETVLRIKTKMLSVYFLNSMYSYPLALAYHRNPASSNHLLNNKYKIYFVFTVRTINEWSIKNFLFIYDLSLPVFSDLSSTTS